MVEMTPGRRVGCEVHLEAPVEQETVHVRRAHAAADAVGRLEDDDLSPSLMQHFCAGEAGQAGPDDYYLHAPQSLTPLQRGDYKRSHTTPPVPYTSVGMLTRLSLLLLQNGDPEGFLEVFQESFRELGGR